MGPLVDVETFRGTVRMSMSEALQPEASFSGGLAESAREDSETALLVIGRLLALLVEKGAISLDDARNVSVQWSSMEIVKED
jgi:hypothetical protein